MKSIFIMLALVACGGKQPPTSKVDNTVKPAVGKEGAVCSIGEAHRGSAVAVACGPGLSCCYPCGIEGCDSVCMSACPVGIP